MSEDTKQEDKWAEDHEYVKHDEIDEEKREKNEDILTAIADLEVMGRQ